MAEPLDGWPYRHAIRVRYGEVDMQQVVFNAHYLAYLDDAMSGWFDRRLRLVGADDDRIDWMLVKAMVEWQGSATFGDALCIACGIARWGTTSFDVRSAASVDDRPVFTASITYVCVTPGTTTKTPVPDVVRRAFGPAPT